MTRTVASSRQGVYIDDMAVGDAATFAKTVTEADILLFAAVSGDTNPVHIDQDFAAATPFKSRIAHGMLSASFISAVLGVRLPGPGTIYLSQSMRFRAPVRVGDTVVATATIKTLDVDKRRVTLETVCKVGDTVVIDGEAVVMADRRPTA
ncbi:MAG: MaoC family dehydratase [Sphingomonadales bacterium]|nr:MaoC family dehydratase [Sphingomonadales bacterium]